MPVSWILLLLVGVLALAAAARLTWSWFHYRGDRLVTCPENMRPAGVRLDARHAVATGLVKGADLRLATCSRWPEKAGCGQECLTQIQASPAGCLVKNILTEWYDDEVCASCGRLFGPINWAGPKPAVRMADARTLDWDEIPVDQLRDVLAKSVPICFACNMANRLVKEHPDLAIDRGRPALTSGNREIPPMRLT